MLDHLGEAEAAAAIEAAFASVVAAGDPEVVTPDLGGSGSTAGLGQVIADAITHGQAG